MGRPKKLDEKILLTGATEYYNVICHGNVSKMTNSGIAKFIEQTYNISLNESSIRRSIQIQSYIAKLKEQDNFKNIKTTVVYETLDVDAFIIKNRTVSLLKKALVQRDKYYEAVSESASGIIKERESLDKRMKILTSENKNLKTQNQELLEELEMLKTETRCLEGRISKLLNILETNVYPEIANELLAERGLLKVNKELISIDGKKQIIDGTEDIHEYLQHMDDKKENPNKSSDFFSKNNVIQGLFDNIEQ